MITPLYGIAFQSALYSAGGGYGLVLPPSCHQRRLTTNATSFWVKVNPSLRLRPSVKVLIAILMIIAMKHAQLSIPRHGPSPVPNMESQTDDFCVSTSDVPFLPIHHQLYSHLRVLRVLARPLSWLPPLLEPLCPSNDRPRKSRKPRWLRLPLCPIQ